MDQFLADLAKHDIGVVMDVRYTPWSRRPLFRKASLSKALAEAGILYVHVPQFGAAPALRKELQSTNDWSQFANQYSANLLASNGTVEMSLTPYRGSRLCLLCLEANPYQCHRSLLAEHLAKVGLASGPIHL